MILRQFLISVGATFTVASSHQDTTNLQQVVLAGLRVTPLDSLTFGACRTLQLDPEVRSLPDPRSFVRTDTPIALKLSFPADSLKTKLPLIFRAYSDTVGAQNHAQILVGIYAPKKLNTDTTSLMVAIGGCRLSGSFVQIKVWRSGSQLTARVRRILEG
jgi:hypothetical protein